VNIYQIIFISIALGCDAFSIALCIGAFKRYPGQKFRLGFHFGLFQSLMFIVGFELGNVLLGWISVYGKWIACFVVGCVAVHMIVESFDKHDEIIATDLSRGKFLILFSVATSLDALAVGFSIGLLGVSPWLPCLMIGLIAAIMTLTGLLIGRRLRSSFGKIAEFGGGVVLLLVALGLLRM